MNCTTRSAIVFTAAMLLGSMSAGSFADEDQFDKTHPRRAEVSHRLNNQDKRIDNEVREGEMTKAKADKLHKQDRHIRKEERAMASEHGGHITRQEQNKLNRQEDAVSKKIGKTT